MKKLKQSIDVFEIMSYLGEEPYHVDIELINKECKCSKMLKDSGISKFNVVDVRGIERGLTRHLINISSERTRDIPENPAIKIEKENKFSGDSLICYESNGCSVCNTIISEGSFLLSGSNLDDSTFIYSFITPSDNALKQILSSLEENGFELKILKIEKYQPHGKSLTDKQEKLLWIAFKMGFFEYPRKIHMRELSKRLGISLSTFSETSRRGLKNVLQHYFTV